LITTITVNFDLPRRRDSWSSIGSNENGAADDAKTRKFTEEGIAPILTNQFHVLSWPAVTHKLDKTPNYSTASASAQPPRPGKDNPPSNPKRTDNTQDDNIIKARLASLLAVLWNNPRSAERRTFRHCSQMAGQSVHNYVKNYPKSVKYAIYLACKDIIRFYLPPGLESPLITKYWGAVLKLLLDMVSKPIICASLKH
jgi:hypothetical protein